MADVSATMAWIADECLWTYSPCRNKRYVRADAICRSANVRNQIAGISVVYPPFCAQRETEFSLLLPSV